MEREIVLATLVAFWLQGGAASPPPIGTLANPRLTNHLDITRPGVYENYLVDAEGREQTAVTIRADNVVLRHCEIRNGRGEGIDVHGKDVTIEYVRIHHMLAGTFRKPVDAHGISGSPQGLTIRHCDISYCSGDSIQFDPARGQWNDVVIEHSRFWTGPLPKDALGFRKGQRPGENALDTKTPKDRTARLTIRSSTFQGFRQPAQMENVAAINLKENVHARVEDCIFDDNEHSLRVRGPDAVVDLRGCSFAHCGSALRVEDDARVSIEELTFGEGVEQHVEYAGKVRARVVEKK